MSNSLLRTPIVEVLDLSVAERDPVRLLGLDLEVPKAGSRSELYAVSVIGWVLGRSAPVSEVEVMLQDTVLRKVTRFSARPDVARAFPGAPGSDACQFAVAVGVLGLPPEFVLGFRAMLRDGAV